MSALDEARRLPDGGTVRWRALELAAFEAHPGVLAALDPAGRHHRRRARVGGYVAGLGILVLLLLVVAPVVAFSIVLVDGFQRDPAPQVSIPTTAIIFLCTLPLLVAVFVSWYRSDRGRDHLRELQVSLLAGFGILSLVVALIRSGSQDYPDGVRWSAGIAVPALLAAIFWLILVRSAYVQLRAARPEVVPGAPDGGDARTGRTVPEPLRPVRLAVEKLPDRDRDAVRRDLLSAIDELQRRGIIDGATADRARDAELGKLALRMSQGSTPR